MTIVAFTVHGLPKPAGSKRAFKHRHTDRIVVTDANKNSREWKNLVRDEAIEAMRPTSPDVLDVTTFSGAPLLDGPLLLSLIFTLPRPKGHYGKKGLRPSAPRFPIVKPDVLKLARAVEDALSKVVYRDDSQIVSETIQKVYGEPAGVTIRVEELANSEPLPETTGATAA